MSETDLYQHRKGPFITTKKMNLPGRGIPQKLHVFLAKIPEGAPMAEP
jgi:hypothetical protein